MGIFLTVLSYAFGLLPSIVTGIQTLVGDTQSGASKKQMATDMLSVALNGASSVTTGQNAALAQLAASTALGIINATDAISTAVSHTKATGAYQAATTAAKATQTAVAGALAAPAQAESASA